MKRRRSRGLATRLGVIFCLCIFGSTKGATVFDFSNSTANTQQNSQSEVPNEDVARTPITPPQPKNKKGQIICTKNRYVQSEQQVGLASWYGGREFHGSFTANGERFDEMKNTIAHLTLPMGTKVLVQNPETGVSVHARVNDCGPFVKGRIADLSYGLAKKLGITGKGVGTVVITVL